MLYRKIISSFALKSFESFFLDNLPMGILSGTHIEGESFQNFFLKTFAKVKTCCIFAPAYAKKCLGKQIEFFGYCSKIFFKKGYYRS